jgi:hypothetical protein
LVTDHSTVYPTRVTVDLDKDSSAARSERVVKERIMDTADQRVLKPAPAPVAPLALTQAKPVQLAPPAPEMNRQERVNFTAHLVMIALLVAFLLATGLVGWLGT